MTDTHVFAWLDIDGHPVFFAKGEETDNTVTDGAEDELKQVDPAKGLGESFIGSTLRGIRLRVSDGSVLTHLLIKDGSGGQVLKVRGKERSIGQGLYDLELRGLALRIEKNMTLNVQTAD